ncbi:MAG TPA: hypothetical protein VFB12_12415 [Ktedonobacteraceae bacterium]|nr:hypothetical protein [Ktedonobacteraceae bacterium]
MQPYQQTLHTETGILTATPPFDFFKSLDFLSMFYPMHGEQEVTATSLTKAILIDGRCIAFRVQAADNGQESQIRYTLFAEEPPDDKTRQAVLERISFFLSLNDDLKPFYAIAQQDANFASIINRLYGLHHIKFLTLCEIACWSVLTQHRAIAVARKMKDALVEHYGGKITVEGRVYRAFPELERLARVSPEEFEALVKNQRCAQYLSEVTKTLDVIGEDFLRKAPYDEAEQALLKIKGIGSWSAAFILLRGLGRMERLLFSAKPMRDAIVRVYGPEFQQEVLAHTYGPYIGYWSFYLRTND